MSDYVRTNVCNHNPVKTVLDSEIFIRTILIN